MRGLLKADMTLLELLEELHRDIEKLDLLYYQATRKALATCILERRRLYRQLAEAGLTYPDPAPGTPLAVAGDISDGIRVDMKDGYHDPAPGL
jgi:hypothetical protein